MSLIPGFIKSLFKSTEFSRDLEQYKIYRSVGMDLNARLVKQLPRAAIEECGKKLGILKKGALILDSEDELAVLMDYALFHCGGSIGFWLLLPIPPKM